MTPLESIIGTVDEVGFSLNPVKAFRAAKAKVVAVKRKTIDRVPVVREVTAYTTQRLNLMNTPYRLGGGFIAGVYTGGSLKSGLAGAKVEAEVTKRQAKAFIQNPVVRYGSKGAAIVFPPLTPVAVGVEAANQAIAAVEQRDPVKALFALTTVANTVAAGAAGDPGAARAAETIAAVRKGAITAHSVAREVRPMFPAVRAAKIGARFSIPAGSKALDVAKAADAILTKAKGSHGKGAADAAKSLILQTLAAAKAGDKGAKAGALALSKVHKAQKAKGKGSFGKAIHAVKGAKYQAAYLVDSRGRVVRGNFVAS